MAVKQNSLLPLGKRTTVVIRVKALNPKSHGLRSSLPKEKSAGGAVEGRNASMTLHRFTLQTVELLQALMSSGDLWEMQQPRGGHLCPRSHSGCSGRVISQEDWASRKNVSFYGDFPGVLSELLSPSTPFCIGFGLCNSQKGPGRKTQYDTLSTAEHHFSRKGNPTISRFPKVQLAPWG